MTLSINGKTYEAGELVAYVKNLEKENAELKTKKIPQLERRIASIRGSHSVDVKKLNARIEQVERLKKENVELNCECRRCVYTDCPCVLFDYGKDRNGICDHFKDVFDENAELKKSCQIQVDSAFQMLYEKDDQLTKAKEIIKKLLHSLKNEGSDYTFALESTHPVLAEAKQFLKDSEVEK